MPSSVGCGLDVSVEGQQNHGAKGTHNFKFFGSTMMFRRIAAVTLSGLLSSPLCLSFHIPSPTRLGGGEIGTSSGTTRTQQTVLNVATTRLPGTAKLDTPWAELGFEYRQTNSHLRITYKDGEWGEAELVKVRRIEANGPDRGPATPTASPSLCGFFLIL
jgi:hypothetical protein